MLITLRCSGRCPQTISSPSTPTQTIDTWGRPSGSRVTRCASPGPCSTARADSGNVITAGTLHNCPPIAPPVQARPAARARRAERPRAADNLRMAYDEDLANRIRELIAAEEGLTEKKMFGGLAFLINGNMSVSASGQGGLLLRVDPEETEALLAKPFAQPMEMRGREMQGWL